MIKIAHESPKSIFKQVQELTDYDYALVHLFENDPEYYELFRKAVWEQNREVILDNSIFELGKAFDPNRFLHWINELRPTWYIVPDVLDDAAGTITNMKDWITNYRDLVEPLLIPDGGKGGMIGVVQGETLKGLIECYDFMVNEAKVDKVALSFDSKWYETACPHPNKLVSWMMGRVSFIGILDKMGILRRDIPHHLLGCALPGEGIFYSGPEFDFIDSMDTSNPIVHGLKKIYYDGPLGLEFKNSEKLYTLINSEVEYGQWLAIKCNILDYRKLWNGQYGRVLSE